MVNGYKFRLYPNPEQQPILLRWIGCQRGIYNAKVQKEGIPLSNTLTKILQIVPVTLVAGALLMGTLAAKPATATAPTLHRPFPWATVLRTDTNQITHLARGKKATIVMGMASWCHFCGYEDRWVMPSVIHTPGVAIDLVDVSSYSGIAQPGPKTPAFSGKDGVMRPATVRQMESAMQRYVRQYHLPPSIHVYIAPSAVQKAWKVTAFPDLWFINAKGVATQHTNGALTLAQMAAVVHSEILSDAVPTVVPSHKKHR